MQILLAIKDYALDILAVLAAFSIIIEVAPIKINLWSKLAKNIGKAFNKPALDKNTSVEQQLRKSIPHTIWTNLTLLYKTNLFEAGDKPPGLLITEVIQ